MYAYFLGDRLAGFSDCIALQAAVRSNQLDDNRAFPMRRIDVDVNRESQTANSAILNA